MTHDGQRGCQHQLAGYGVRDITMMLSGLGWWVTSTYRKVMSKLGMILPKVKLSSFWLVFTGCITSGRTNTLQGWVDSAWCCKSFAIVWKQSQNSSLWTKLKMNSGSPVSYEFGVWENKTAQDIAIGSSIFLKIISFLRLKVIIYFITLPVVNEVKCVPREE